MFCETRMLGVEKKIRCDVSKLQATELNMDSEQIFIPNPEKS